MEPLLGDMPLVGALSLFFLKKPVSPDDEILKQKEVGMVDMNLTQNDNSIGQITPEIQYDVFLTFHSPDV